MQRPLQGKVKPTALARVMRVSGRQATPDVGSRPAEDTPRLPGGAAGDQACEYPALYVAVKRSPLIRSEPARGRPFRLPALQVSRR
jgi:hypothetical protein